MWILEKVKKVSGTRTIVSESLGGDLKKRILRQINVLNLRQYFTMGFGIKGPL